MTTREPEQHADANECAQSYAEAQLAMRQETMRRLAGRQAEIRAAIEAADEALARLREADDKLGSARGWSLADMMGLDLIGGFMKNWRLNKAREPIDAAREAVQHLARQLTDVSGVEQIHIEMGDFLTFADLVFDNFVVDALAYQRIEKTRTDIREAIIRIEGMRRDLQMAANAAEPTQA